MAAPAIPPTTPPAIAPASEPLEDDNDEPSGIVLPSRGRLISLIVVLKYSLDGTSEQKREYVLQR